VIECATPVRIPAFTPLLLTPPGTQIGMRVNTEGGGVIGTEWSEEKNGTW
jgi:hypothetical protein